MINYFYYYQLIFSLIKFWYFLVMLYCDDYYLRIHISQKIMLSYSNLFVHYDFDPTPNSTACSVRGPRAAERTSSEQGAGAWSPAEMTWSPESFPPSLLQRAKTSSTSRSVCGSLASSQNCTPHILVRGRTMI